MLKVEEFCISKTATVLETLKSWTKPASASCF